MPPWALVTPASRGIGLALARRLLRSTELPVVATARKDLDQTKEAILSKGEDGSGEGDESRLEVLKLDMLDESSIEDAASKCRERFPAGDKQSPGSHLHVAFVIPGMLHPEKSPAQLEYGKINETFQLNTIAPMLVLKHFHGFLPRKATPVEAGSDVPAHATWAQMSARVGSITDNKGLGGWYSYRASKAALNQIVRSFDNNLRSSAGNNAIAVALHPGTVKTGLSRDFWNTVKPEKLFSPEFAADSLWEVVKGLEAERARGRIFDWQGEEIEP